jgi:hypothetical protein
VTDGPKQARLIPCRRFLSVALCCLPLLSAAAVPALKRRLAGLTLGETLWSVKRRYPPLRTWPEIREQKGGVDRYIIRRGSAKGLPAFVDELRLGFKGWFLVEIQVIMTKSYSEKNPPQQVALNLALLYGPPKRSPNVSWWADGRTVMRILDEPAPRPPKLTKPSKPPGFYDPYLPPPAEPRPRTPARVDLRTSLQIFDRKIFE